MTFDDPILFDAAYTRLHPHLGHKLTTTFYGGNFAPDNIAIECEECHEVLVDFNPEKAR